VDSGYAASFTSRSAECLRRVKKDLISHLFIGRFDDTSTVSEASYQAALKGVDIHFFDLYEPEDDKYLEKISIFLISTIKNLQPTNP